MKVIEVIVNPAGQARIEARGFPGTACRDATGPLERALGIRTAEQLTAEFHQDRQADRSLPQSQ